jgi:uncharacterized protein YbaP (TraB family)
MLAATFTFAASATIPINVLADAGPRKWPLWAIRQGEKTIYLTGETPPQSTDWHDDRIERLLLRCSSMWTETNDIFKQDQGELVNRYGIDPKRPLDSWLDASDKARLVKAAAYCEVDLLDLAPYKPWLVGSLLQEKFYQVAGWKGKSARQILADRAMHMDIPTRSEFAVKDDVLAWFGALTPLQSVQFLRYALDEILAGPAADTSIFKDWAAGRLRAATAEVEGYSRIYPELAQRLTLNRNDEWLPRFEAMFSSPGTPLVVVGLYHVVGPSGILALARRRGYVVEPLQGNISSI